eukprot:g3956.t1
MYQTANRGKRSLTVDLKAPEGRALLHRLVATADVVLHNFSSPDVAASIGASYADLRRVRGPDLIYLGISGYGSSGPYAEARAKVYDQAIQPMAGVGEITAPLNPALGPTFFDNLIIDKVTALNAAQAVTAALFARERGRGGQHIRLNMLDAAVHFLFVNGYADHTWPDVQQLGRSPPRTMDFDCADGKVTLVVSMRAFLEGLLDHLGGGLERLLDPSNKDPRHWVGVRRKAFPLIRDRVKGMTKQQVFDLCLRAGVPCGKYNTVDEVLADPQVLHNGTVQELVDPTFGRWRTPKPPAEFTATPSKVQGPAPRMGEDSDEILQAECGLSEEEIEGLRERGIVGKRPRPIVIGDNKSIGAAKARL